MIKQQNIRKYIFHDDCVSIFWLFWNLLACDDDLTSLTYNGLFSVTQSCLTLCDPIDCICQAILSMEFSRQEYWSGCHFLLQGIFPTQGSNQHLLFLLHWQVDSLLLSHLGSPTYNRVMFYVEKIVII